jgi:O-antigen chain-terminating methyltransferase
MPPDRNVSDRILLDSAARLVRERITPDSYLYPLQQGHGRNGVLRSPSSCQSGLSLPASERLARAVEWGQPQVGDMPPRPPTLRGRVGAILVGIVRRMLFWYTGQIRSFHAGVAGAVAEQSRALRELSAGDERRQAQLSAVVERLAALERHHEVESQQARQSLESLQSAVENLDEIPARLAALHRQAAFDCEHARQLREKQDALAHSAAVIAERLSQMEQALAASGQQWETLAGRLSEIERAPVVSGHSYMALLQEEAKQRESLSARLDQTEQAHVLSAAAEQRRRDTLADHLTSMERAQESLTEEARQHREAIDEYLRQIRRQVHDAGMQILRQELRLTVLLREARAQSIPERIAGPDSPAAEEARHPHDALFVDYAQTFRGSPAEIKNRLSVYLERARQAFRSAADAPALDLGCGRGEWLEIMRDATIPATGIDTNRELVRACREQGLDALEGAVPQMLRSLPDRSRSILTAFHVLEHLPFADLVEVIDHVVRLLHPGGIAIFETPNPKNLLVSTNNFYLDPTHQHPLPSEFLAFVIESRGLCDPEVIPLSPYPDCFHLPAGSPAADFINRHFFGPQEYGIIARKP